MALIALGLGEVVASLEPDGRPGWLTLLLAGGGAVAVYAAALVLLRVDELRPCTRSSAAFSPESEAVRPRVAVPSRRRRPLPSA